MEDYLNFLVPENLSLILKEAGFDEKCLVKTVCVNQDTIDTITIHYTNDYYDVTTNKIYVEDLKLISNSELLKNELGLYEDYKTFVARPTWEQVFKWFRDKLGLNIVIYTKNKIVCNIFNPHDKMTRTFYYFKIYDISTGKCLGKSDYSETYEESRYTAVEYITNEHIETNKQIKTQ